MSGCGTEKIAHPLATDPSQNHLKMQIHRYMYMHVVRSVKCTCKYIVQACTVLCI